MLTGVSFSLAPSDRARLVEIAADRNSPQKNVWRAQIGKRKPSPRVDGLGFRAAGAMASLQFQGRSSLSLETKCPRAS